MKTQNLEKKHLDMLQGGLFDEVVYDCKTDEITYTFTRGINPKSGDNCILCTGDNQSNFYESAFSCWNNDFHVIATDEWRY